jgi:hypothetical protein
MLHLDTSFLGSHAVDIESPLSISIALPVSMECPTPLSLFWMERRYRPFGTR